MKKLMALLLALALALPCVSLAEPAVEESAPLTREELEIYLDAMTQAAREDESRRVDPGNESFYPSVTFSGGELQIADETFDESTAVLGFTVGEHQADPRGLFLFCSVDEALAAYPNDNPDLAGSYFDAALYIHGEKPEVTTGYVVRLGQQVVSVWHQVYSWRPDGVAVSSVNYAVDQGYVYQIDVRLDYEVVDEAAALAEIQEVADMQEITGYSVYPHSADNGEALAPFQREDLTFTEFGQKKADFLDLNAEEAIAAFGAAQVDEWTEDSDGSFLRLMQWEGISLLLQYDAQRKFLAVDSLTLNDMMLDGPRGVRVGDTLDSVIYRFRHGETFTADDTLSLYGDGQTLPYGMLAYSPESAELSYAFALEDGKTVVWHMTFVAGELESMTMMLR